MGKRWEWRVDEHVVSAELAPRTGMIAIAIDDEGTLRKRVWWFTAKLPFELPDGRPAIVTLSTGNRLGLEVGGRTIEPTVAPRMSMLQRVVWGTAVLAWVWVATLAVAPWLVGGRTLGPPTWSTDDLVPPPSQEENAWDVMMHGAAIPDRGDQWLLDDYERVSQGDWPEAEEELARTDVAALLEGVPEVLSRPGLGPSLDEENVDVLGIVDWRYWLALSLNRRLEQEPHAVVEVLTKTVPLWVDCANRARANLLYCACAAQARRDLTLLEGSLEYLGTSAEGSLVAIREAAEKSAELSSENVMRAGYVEAYESLRSGVSATPLFVDRRKTLSAFNELIENTSEDSDCAFPSIDLWKALYRYNHMGTVFAEINTRLYCSGFARAAEVTRSVVDARTRLLAKLDEVGSARSP